MTIGIIGLGYVGLTLAVAAADSGIEVYGTEINPHIKECLKQNKAHFFEPGLDALIAKYNGNNLKVVDQFSKDAGIDAFIITVGTPLKKGEKTPNFEYIKLALESMKGAYTGKELVILRSTVSVGTTRNVVRPYLQELSGVEENEILVSMCPERTVEGKALEELKGLPQIISGNNEKSLEIAQNLFRKITPYVIPVDSLEEAEIVKLFCNTYRDMTFSIGNAFCMAAQAFGIDGTKAIKHANMGYSRSNIALPGFVAGPCLEKDAYILTNAMPESASKELILTARHFNESLEDFVVEWVERKAGAPSKDKVVVLSGMAFKGVPETSDLRGSSSVYIAEKLHAKGYKLRFHDFVAYEEEMNALGLGEIVSDLYAACEGADALCILNNHKKYANIDAKGRLADDSFPVLDAWDVCQNLRAVRKADIYTLGNMMI